MHNQELQLIDGLFNRLQEAEQQSASRDSAAESHIQKRLSTQPAAPYYMAQVILIQEAAMKQMDQRLKALEAQVTQLQSTQQNSGGFLSGLFGGNKNTPQPPQTTGNGYEGGQPANYAQTQQSGSTGGGFLAGAAQTAIGVAGGMLLADALSDMFSDEDPSPEALAGALEDTPTVAEASPEPEETNDDAFQQASADESSFLDEGDDESFI